MGHKKRLKEKPTSGELRRTGETYMGNVAQVKINENPMPEYNNDEYRADIRIYPDFSVTKRVKKSCPTLAVYNATNADINVLMHSLASAIISLKNAKRKLNKANGENVEDEEDDI